MISTVLCSPCRGITISGTGSVQEDVAHERPHLEESRIVALTFLFCITYIKIVNFNI